MKLYLDTGNVDEVREAASYGILDGVTTNPSLIAKEGKDFKTTVKNITSILRRYNKDFTVSAEVTEIEHKKMLKQALELSKIDKNVIIKVPLIPEGIKTVYELSKKGIKTNVTLCFSANQALLAAKAGAYIVSPFLGRIDDMDNNSFDIIEDIKIIYDNYGYKTQILSASIRSPRQISESAVRGCDICTIPYNIFQKMFYHPLTDIGQEKFLSDWKKYQQDVKKSNKKVSRK